MDMVFKSKVNAEASHWAHIMCDPDYQSWQSIEVFEERKDDDDLVDRFKKAKRVGKNICAWPSSFAHIDESPDMSKFPLLAEFWKTKSPILSFASVLLPE